MNEQDIIHVLVWVVGVFGTGLIAMLGFMTSVLVKKLDLNDRRVMSLNTHVTESIERLERTMRDELRQFEVRLTRLETVTSVEKYFNREHLRDVPR